MNTQNVEPAPTPGPDHSTPGQVAEAMVTEPDNSKRTVVINNFLAHDTMYYGLNTAFNPVGQERRLNMANISDNLESIATEYERQGVIRLRGLFTAGQVERVLRELARYIQDLGPTLPESDIVYETDGRSVRNLWRMEHHDPYFRGLAADPELLQLLQVLLHGEPVLLGVETFNKPARVGSGIPAHQDNAYFCQDPPDVLTVWIAIDAATPSNGPVNYVRGSHRLGALPHKPSGVRGNTMGLDAPFDDSDPFVGTLDPGDALIHHCQTIHYSSPNTTDRSRCGLLMVFRGKHTLPTRDLLAKYQSGKLANA
jgi:hypothetical protein